MPNSSGRGGYYNPLTKDDLRARIKEIEQRIKQIDRREKALGDLKKWLAHRHLDAGDLGWMIRKMKPKRADKPVKSRKPLHPAVTAVRSVGHGKMPIKGDAVFMSSIRAARLEKELRHEDVGAKVGVSAASVANWEQGRYVPKEEARAKLVKFLGLPADLGAEASARMMQAMGRNGAAAD